MSWPHGRMRYNLAMLAELSQLRLLPFRLVLDGRDEIVTDLTLAAFGNTRSYGGGMLVCPNADPTDGHEHTVDWQPAQIDARNDANRPHLPGEFHGRA